ncbi:hypothetical protein [Thermincola potens]|uniref:hypothetical protein n=1 Tax=Thermincola potens TaxID=863643 RepID=UPI0002DB77B4|nr:hypothetical protein [Thermincola potens]
MDLEYIDIDDERVDDFPNITKYIDDPQIPLPIVSLNERFVWAGPIILSKLLAELDKELFKPSF